MQEFRKLERDFLSAPNVKKLYELTKRQIVERARDKYLRELGYV